MSKGKQILVWGGIAGAVAGIAYLFRLATLKKELKVITKAMIWDVSLTKGRVMLRIDTVLKNPTGTSLTLTQPFVNLKYNGKDIGSSKPSGTKIIIPKNDQIQIDPIYIEVPITSLGFSLASLLTVFGQNGKVSLEQRTISIETLYYLSPDTVNKLMTDTQNITIGGDKGRSVQKT